MGWTDSTWKFIVFFFFVGVVASVALIIGLPIAAYYAFHHLTLFWR